jgi:hypothetical protein
VKKWAWAGVLAAACAGCGTERTWIYRPETAAARSPLLVLTVAVPPFQDLRANANTDELMHYAMPVFPFGWQNLSHPEYAQRHANTGPWLWKPDEDLAQATVAEIDRARIFGRVTFTRTGGDADLRLEGAVKSTQYRSKTFGYGLSVFGPLFWILGAPSDSFENELILGFRLVESGNGKVLWEKEYSRRIGKTSWIYDVQDDFRYPELAKAILRQLSEDLAAVADLGPSMTANRSAGSGSSAALQNQPSPLSRFSKAAGKACGRKLSAARQTMPTRPSHNVTSPLITRCTKLKLAGRASTRSALTLKASLNRAGLR